MTSLPVIQDQPVADREPLSGPATELAVDGMSCAACAAYMHRHESQMRACARVP